MLLLLLCCCSQHVQIGLNIDEKNIGVGLTNELVQNALFIVIVAHDPIEALYIGWVQIDYLVVALFARQSASYGPSFGQFARL